MLNEAFASGLIVGFLVGVSFRFARPVVGLIVATLLFGVCYVAATSGIDGVESLGGFAFDGARRHTPLSLGALAGIGAALVLLRRAGPRGSE